jgi:hypothetical protein
MAVAGEQRLAASAISTSEPVAKIVTSASSAAERM